MSGQHLIRRKLRHAFARPTASGASAIALIADAVNRGRRRHILNVRVDNLGTTRFTLNVYQGDAASPTRTQIDQITVPATQAQNSVFLPGSIKAPIYTIIPDTTTGTASASGNNIYISPLTNPASRALRFSCQFWDEL